MEETLSTLEYAIRAKNIRNKPELNQRMTRNSLLKEYVAEIERLKADLLAAREKNGIFFSEETWNQLNAEQEMRQTEIEEARKHVEIVESQMRSVREEFEQSIALLMKKDGELKQTREQLRETAGELEVKVGELKVMKIALEEEAVVRQAYQENEAILNEVAHGLKKTAKENVRDVNGLFEKLRECPVCRYRFTSDILQIAKLLCSARTLKLSRATARPSQLRQTPSPPNSTISSSHSRRARQNSGPRQCNTRQKSSRHSARNPNALISS
jgi:chromosome segregation ATPase